VLREISDCNLQIELQILNPEIRDSESCNAGILFSGLGSQISRYFSRYFSILYIDLFYAQVFYTFIYLYILFYIVFNTGMPIGKLHVNCKERLHTRAY